MTSYRLSAAVVALVAAVGCGGDGGGGPSNADPVANFAFSCTGSACDFSDASSDVDACDAITSYDWNFGDGTPHATIQNPSHSFTASSPAT